MTGARVFFAYSHRDEGTRDAIEKHLAVLKHEKLIQAWHDRKIGPGHHIHESIREKLEGADLFILLVSPDFLDSRYCYEVELSRALERRAEGTATVLPVIAQHCEWPRTPLGDLLAVPRDGTPIADYKNPDQAYAEVAKAIRSAATEILNRRQSACRPAAPQASEKPDADRGTPPVADLRLPRQFSDRERDDYAVKAFEDVSTMFEDLIQQLAATNPSADVRFERLDRTHFNATIYGGGRRMAYARVWRETRDGTAAGIGYSGDPSSGDNSYNERLHVVDDKFTLGLEASFGAFTGSAAKGMMTPKEAAAHLFGILLRDAKSRGGLSA